MTTMRLPELEFAFPQTIDQAVEMKARWGRRSAFMAGGTDAVPLLKRRNLDARKIISLRQIPDLAEIKTGEDGWLEIGPLVSLAQLIQEPFVVQNYPVLAQAAGSVAANQIRNRATLIGNLCLDSKCTYFNQSALWWASRPDCFKRGGEKCYVIKAGKKCQAYATADTAPALIALHAEANITGPEGCRQEAVADLFSGNGLAPLALQEGEMITALRLPAPVPNWREKFIKRSRRGVLDFAIASLALRIRFLEGRLFNARLVLGSVSTAPVRATQAESFLIEAELSAPAFEEAAELALKQIGPLSMINAAPLERRALIKAMIIDGLTELTQTSP